MMLADPSLTVLDVGHGNAAVVHEAGFILVVDAGGRSDLLEFLLQHSIDTVDLVLISHSDADHIGGLVGLLAAGIKVGCVRVNSDAEKESAAWRDLVVVLEDARRRGELRFEVGLSSGLVPDTGFAKCQAEIVAPTPEIIAFGAGSTDRHGRRITSNTISACIRIDYEGNAVALLAGDMDDVSLDSCIAAKTDLRAPVVVFPHHGGLPGSGDAAEFAAKLMDQTKPSRVFFSIGRTKFENPRPEVVSIVKGTGAYIACTQLSKHCADDVVGMSTSGVSQSYSAGTLKGHCCAGTMTVGFAATDLFATHEAHVKFVGSLTKRLCK